MIIPMDELRVNDIFTRYISPTWSSKQLEETPENTVLAKGGDILLVKTYYSAYDKTVFRFMKIGYNYTGYCTRVKLVAMPMGGYKAGRVPTGTASVREYVTDRQAEQIERMAARATPIVIKIDSESIL